MSQNEKYASTESTQATIHIPVNSNVHVMQLLEQPLKKRTTRRAYEPNHDRISPARVCRQQARPLRINKRCILSEVA